MNAKLDRLADLAVTTAAKAARDYLDKNRLKADTDDLLHCLKHNVKLRIDEALRDANEALEARMDVVAVQTFMAAMQLAGIAAAKAVLTEPA